MSLRINVLRTSDIQYELPAGLIATHPVSPRDAARMMVVEREGVRHMLVRELPGLLRRGDVLVLNTTRVLPARFHTRRTGTGGKAEGLYLGTVGDGRWEVLIKGGHLRPGVELELLERDGRGSGVVMVIEGRGEAGSWLVRVEGVTALEVLERVGETPLPPYIVKARAEHAGLGVRAMGEEPGDRERYQTVYATGEGGSVAAPTAGLHFTPELLARIESLGVTRVDVVLHVGAGTFKPVETEFVEQHPMHAEWCSMGAAAVAEVVAAKREGRRVIAVGTTATRTLEAYAAAVEAGGSAPVSMETRLLITPGYRFRWVEGLLTNFHLPGSTLMALVGAFLEWKGMGGVERLKRVYGEAVKEGYRFYSFGDAMVVV